MYVPITGDVTNDAAKVADTRPYAELRSSSSVISATYAKTIEKVTANVPLIDKRAKNHQGEIDISGIGAQVQTTVNSKNIRLPQTSLNI